MIKMRFSFGLLVFTLHYLTSITGLEVISTQQDLTSQRPSRIFVQLLTEPESLIRVFEGLNLSFQMLRHIGRTGPALMRLPFDKNFLTNEYDHVGLDSWKRPFYSRLPTMLPHEAPRYIRIPDRRHQHHASYSSLVPLRYG